MAGGFRVAECTVEPQLNPLKRNGHTIRVEPKVMQVLVCLSERHGDLVTKEQLIQAVWPDIFVADDVLTRCISELRKALGDEPKQPRFIETISKSGYRLIAPVQPLTSETSPQKRSWLLPGVVLVFLLLVGLGVALLLRARLTGTTAKVTPLRSIAVLPLEDLSHDPGQEFFADGMTDELINEVGQVKALRVVSRTSVMQFKGSRKPLKDIAKALNVDAVLEGVVLRSGGRVRITAELIDARFDRQLWAHSYEGDLGDVLKLQSTMAGAIMAEIQIAVTAQEQQRITSTRRVDPEALDSYLRGQFYWNQFSEEGMHKAVEHFQKAIDKDPSWAAAYAGQAHAYHELSWYQPPKQVMPKAKWAAEKAIQIDPKDADAHAARGWVKWVYEWDWPGAEAEFKRAIEFGPNSSRARAQYALFLSAEGRSREALEQEHLALELDPLSLINNTNLGDILTSSGQMDQAIAQYRKVIGIDPHFGSAHEGLGFAYARTRRFEEAVKEIQIGLEYDHDPQYRGELAWTYAIAGQKQRAQEILQELNKLSNQQYIPASISVEALAALGEKEKAIAALERGAQERESNFGIHENRPGIGLFEFRSPGSTFAADHRSTLTAASL
jgi:TolB-like protein/DNA-binding winged helix-turn-helix (wHTH) protein/Tfp pilus assembly protein PilF